MSPERVGGQWMLPLGDVPEAEAQLLAEVLAAVVRAREARQRSGFPGVAVVRVSEAPGVPPDIRGQIEGHEPRPRRKNSA